MQETGVPGENYWPVASCWQTLSHNVVSSTPCHERDSNSQHYWWYALIAQVVRKSNYHYDHDGPLNWNKVFFMKCRFNLVQMKIPWSIDNKHIWKVYRNFSSNFVAVLRQRKKNVVLYYGAIVISLFLSVCRQNGFEFWTQCSSFQPRGPKVQKWMFLIFVHGEFIFIWF